MTPQLKSAAQALLIGALLAQSSDAFSQDATASFATQSVLTLAKNEAETASSERSRTTLRNQVAVAMRRTGAASSFPGYVESARAAIELKRIADADRNNVARDNLKIDREAEAAFLDGDIEQAKLTLGRCVLDMEERNPPCAPGHMFFDYETFLTLKFMFWEIHANRLDAALRRLKSAPLSADTFQIFLPLIGPLIVQGDAGRTREVQRLFRLSGLEQDSCLLIRTFSFGEQKPSRKTSKPAQIRKLACEGNIESAIEAAMSYKDVSMRVQALAIVAEGLAGIAGPSDEQIYVM